MTTEIKVPVLPESIADAEVVGWHKQPGDRVKRDENLVDIETDKVVLEVPAPCDGVLTEITEQAGATVIAEQLLGAIDETAVLADEKNTAAATEVIAMSQEIAINPAAKKLMLEHNITPDEVSGSGKGGRILKEDVMQLVKSREANNAVAEKLAALVAGTESAAEAEQLEAGERTEKRVPMTRLRARIAERLIEAQQNAAILTTFNEVNMQPVMDLRSRYKDKFEKEYGVRLGFMSFFVKATVEALKRFPSVNASIDGNDIVYHGYFDIGVAVSSPRGLVVPVLRNADQLDLAQIEKTIRDLGQKAQDNALSIDDMSGGTFTISNGGVFGSLLSTPILNPPQSGILGMHAIQQRPVAENDQVVIRPMMYLAHSYDHRIIDGKEAVQFLLTIKELLEDPARMLIGV
ncbi:MAG: 2-oxoglutarate dehydrogenase complex dihydrolipoyllysine-residue succinyltransferase [Gammaproteobacteria bacterium]|nr:2-oxoglutarate dehydrogenase complex dihydrolipoyllysine-residue succinyltransferase [Gammaproteobacteria bacterium]